MGPAFGRSRIDASSRRKYNTIAGPAYASKKPMSLADCFAAALARERKAVLYTGDPEFKQVEDDVEIAWLQAP